MNYIVRALTVADESIVWTMLIHAAHETSLESVKNQPVLSRYAIDWGRAGDAGCGAFVGEKSIGAAWLRLWPNEDQGFGCIDPKIPELAIAVLPEYRGHGVGNALLLKILSTASALFSAVSLSVRADNPAIELYQRSGFIKVSGSEVVNRVGSISFNMLCEFKDRSLLSN
jgi:ribosomal protein S18 acetylase RimI-like enzyme